VLLSAAFVRASRSSDDRKLGGLVLAPCRSEAWRIGVRTLLTSAAMLVLIALAAWGLARRERALQQSEKRIAP